MLQFGTPSHVLDYGILPAKTNLIDILHPYSALRIFSPILYLNFMQWDSIIFATYRHEDENSTEAESYSNPTTQVKASINDDEKGEVQVVISCFTQKTK